MATWPLARRKELSSFETHPLESDCNTPILKRFGVAIDLSSAFTALQLWRIFLPASSKRSPAAVGTTGERRRPVEQFDVEFRFELRDAGRDRRLRYRDTLRAFRETAGLGDRDEMFDLIELHG